MSSKRKKPAPCSIDVYLRFSTGDCIRFQSQVHDWSLLGAKTTPENECGTLGDEIGALFGVRSFPEFEDQPKVVKGASDLLIEIFGEAGKHARLAIGAGDLPLGAPVEVEMILEIEV